MAMSSPQELADPRAPPKQQIPKEKECRCHFKPLVWGGWRVPFTGPPGCSRNKQGRDSAAPTSARIYTAMQKLVLSPVI